MKNYDEVIKEFLSTDPLREALMKPALIEEFVFATNGYIAIKIPTNKLSGTYQPNPEYPNIVLLFNMMNYLIKPIVYKVESIEKVLSNIPIVPTGLENDLFSKETEYAWRKHKFQIGEAIFNPNYINKLVTVCKVNDIKQIECFEGMPEEKNYFRIDGVEIIIMPMRIDNIENDSNAFHKLEEETT
jgi:hypothetical protein